MRTFFIAATFITMIAVFHPPERAWTADEVIFKDTISSINKHELYMFGVRFFIAPDVKIFLKTDYGKPLNLKELVAVGRIEKAAVYMKGSVVKKIIVLEMRM